MSITPLNRRNFLSLGKNSRNHPTRPPWAIAESEFLDNCTRCGDCLEKCPENILVHESVNGYPTVDFKLGECTFCGDCVDICSTAALNRSPTAWHIKAQVTAACLAHDQVVCQTCGEQCDAKAIRFDPVVGSVALPTIVADLCTGCGACVAPCPTQSIEVRV